MQVSAIAYLLVAVGLILIGLGIYGVIKGKFHEPTSGSGAGVTFTLPLSALVLIMGIGSLTGAAYFSIKTPVTTKPGSAASSPKPATQPSLEPTPSKPSGAVLIMHPAYGSNVEACGVLSGTAHLPSDETLVLSAQNMSDPAKMLYLQPVNDWDRPSAISAWTGYQYFGSGDSSVGQTFEVSAVVMKTAMVKQALSQSGNKSTWAVPSLPNGADIKASIRLVRKQGSGPTVCQ